MARGRGYLLKSIQPWTPRGTARGRGQSAKIRPNLDPAWHGTGKRQQLLKPIQPWTPRGTGAGRGNIYCWRPFPALSVGARKLEGMRRGSCTTNATLDIRKSTLKHVNWRLRDLCIHSFIVVWSLFVYFSDFPCKRSLASNFRAEKPRAWQLSMHCAETEINWTTLNNSNIVFLLNMCVFLVLDPSRWFKYLVSGGSLWWRNLDLILPLVAVGPSDTIQLFNCSIYFHLCIFALIDAKPLACWHGNWRLVTCSFTWNL